MKRVSGLIIVFAVLSALCLTGCMRHLLLGRRHSGRPMHIVLEADKTALVDAAGKPLSKSDIDARVRPILPILRRRAADMGLDDLSITSYGPIITIDATNTQPQQVVLSRLVPTGALEIYALPDVQSDRNPAARWRMYSEPGATTGEDVLYFEDAIAHTTLKTDTPTRMQVVMKQVINAYDPKTNPSGVKPVISTGDLVPNSRGNMNMDRPVIEMDFTASGTDKFREFTTKHIGEVTVIVLDGRILTAPRIVNPITDGKAVITGFKTLQEAQEKAMLLNSGALPVPLKVVSVN